jgi:phosphatidylserine/phosphatidylglycerophosphate/cardiolipin synthase-like enzyme
VDALGIPVVLTATASAAASSLALITEPNAGMAPIYHRLEGAKRSVDLTVYELSDPTAETILAADAARGVTVRVLLDEHYEQSENSRRSPISPLIVSPSGGLRLATTSRTKRPWSSTEPPRW